MPTPAPLLYPRGFLLTQSAQILLEDLDHYAVTTLGGALLYHDVATPLDVFRAPEGWLATIGTTLPSSTGSDLRPRAARAEELWTAFHEGGLEALEDELYDLGGRHAVMASNGQETWVYHDAAGSRSVYYDTANGNVGSHYDMMAMLNRRPAEHAGTVGKLRLDLRNRYTAHSDIECLLPNHRLVAGKMAQERFHLSGPNRARTLDVEASLRIVISAWESQLACALDQADEVAFSMTGGIDSRLLLALADAHRDTLTSFTYTYSGAQSGAAPKTAWDRSMEMDFNIVQRLRPFLPARHTFITKPDESRSSWRAEHAATLRRNSEGTHGQWLLPSYLELFPSRNTLHYRGNIVGLGRLVLADPSALHDPHGRLRKLIKSRSRAGADLAPHALRIHDAESVQAQYDSVHPDYELTDVWYWENRLARWYGQLLNETDVAFDTFTPFNTRRIIDSFLALDPVDRKAGLMQRELIYRGNPYLTFTGINEMTDLYRAHVSPGPAGA